MLKISAETFPRIPSEETLNPVRDGTKGKNEVLFGKSMIFRDIASSSYFGCGWSGLGDHTLEHHLNNLSQPEWDSASSLRRFSSCLINSWKWWPMEQPHSIFLHTTLFCILVKWEGKSRSCSWMIIYLRNAANLSLPIQLNVECACEGNKAH